jgi:hypothetical protein
MGRHLEPTLRYFCLFCVGEIFLAVISLSSDLRFFADFFGISLVLGVRFFWQSLAHLCKT